MPKKSLTCVVCGERGDSNYGWWNQRLLLAIRPNRRDGKKAWICRKCLAAENVIKLDDRDFLKLIEKLLNPEVKKTKGKK